MLIVIRCLFETSNGLLLEVQTEMFECGCVLKKCVVKKPSSRPYIAK